jgi:hypothetical protein
MRLDNTLKLVMFPLESRGGACQTKAPNTMRIIVSTNRTESGADTATLLAVARPFLIGDCRVPGSPVDPPHRFRMQLVWDLLDR